MKYLVVPIQINYNWYSKSGVSLHWKQSRRQKPIKDTRFTKCFNGMEKGE